MEIKIESTYKGTRILFSETAKKKRTLINKMIKYRLIMKLQRQTRQIGTYSDFRKS